MRQVIWNLVRNAIQASSPGDDVLVRVVDDASGARSLEVCDLGPGISADARPRLFDAFFTTRSQGMGIGLAVVMRIVDDHGFEVEAESAEGRGTRFRVRIPRESVLAVEPAEEAPASEQVA
jgi:signal transduction histidine kinase